MSNKVIKQEKKKTRSTWWWRWGPAAFPGLLGPDLRRLCTQGDKERQPGRPHFSSAVGWPPLPHPGTQLAASSLHDAKVQRKANHSAQAQAAIDAMPASPLGPTLRPQDCCIHSRDLHSPVQSGFTKSPVRHPCERKRQPLLSVSGR